MSILLTMALALAALLAMPNVLEREPCPVVVALASHGVFDVKHVHRLTNPNIPIWLAVPWIGFDIAASYWRPRRPAIVLRTRL
ncbi:MAG TPA: hypothetical protein VG798_05530 [Rhizomicrobium sp.]|nr:hypothetical protein [Rhizomicrobium sp.]